MMTDTSDSAVAGPGGPAEPAAADVAVPPADGAAAAPARDTHFDFQHKVFSLPGAFFCLAADSKQPVLNIMLGDLKAALPFGTLRESFDIADDSPDARLLSVVEKGLNYVKLVRPGERIPGELLDGSASWSVEERHRTIARGRLTVQLVSWITGSEMVVVDQQELEQVVEDPQTKTRLKTAFREIAARLGITENAEQAVTDRVENLAQELSYIEALRERFRCIRAISDNLNRVQALYRTDRTLTAEISRMQGLMRKPLKEYDAVFEQADAQTGEIVGALKDFKTTVAFIRKIRDDLRARLMEWEEVLQAWDGVAVERSQTIEQLQKSTYRFLANRFMESKVWERR